MQLKEAIECLAQESWKAAFNVKMNEYNEMYVQICKQYTEIRMHKLWSSRIGEYVARYLSAIEDSEQNAKNGILDVFVLTDCIYHNARLSKIIGRNIQIVDQTNVYKWIYILSHFPKVEFTKYWNDYTYRSDDRIFMANNTVRFLGFTEEEEKEGEYKKQLMGLCNPYVCIESRDSAYLSVTEPELDYTYHNYRDSDVNKFNLSADYLYKHNINTVRMGRYVLNKVSFNNCIDYANEFYDELMDIYLMKGCKFYVGDPNGITMLPAVLNRPVAFKNAVPVFIEGYGSLPRNPQHLLIFKKYFYKKENRFCSVKEMMQIDKQVGVNGHIYEQLGIEVIENSAEEILDLVMEMNARIDGEWVETPEDIALQKKYQEMLKEWCEEESMKESALPHSRIGAMFLRKNSFLLE